MKNMTKRLTYANVMSSLAVFLVLGGATAFAATKIGANQLKANSVKTGKIVKEAITTSKIKNNAVNGAKVNEGTLGQVPSAATANFALSSENAAPRAYAKVLGGGGVDTGLAKNITAANISLVGTSVYCFELGFDPKNVQTTVEWIGGKGGTAHAAIGKYSGCPAGSDASVRVADKEGDADGTINFYVSFVG